MKIAFVASEMGPYAKTGGLADVTGALSTEILRQGHEVIAFLPRYKSVPAAKWNMKVALDGIEVWLGNDREAGRLWQRSEAGQVTTYFLEHNDFYERDAFYGTANGDYPDNDRRFIFFQRAALESLKRLNFKPDVIHCHDWQAGLIPVYLKTIYAQDSFFQKTRSVFTIHNLAYQGNFPPDSLPVTGLPWEQFRMERLEFYGKISFMKGALLDADSLSTVSETYAKEIQGKEFGCGMEGVLARRKDHLHGIVNGIDYDEWNPETDKEIFSNYSAAKIEKKSANKNALQKENNLNLDPKVPVIGMVSRLVDQKGLDLLIPALSRLLRLGVQFVLLGTGEERYHHILREFAKKNKGQAAVHILFDTKMAKSIYAGSDMMIFPSYYEPCGLGQMIALRFGTIPVVRQTGGLADTVTEFDAKNAQGTGFVFKEYTSEAFLDSVQRALAVYANEKKWHDLMRGAMSQDFSWKASARRYVELYESTKRRPVEGAEKRHGK